MTFVQIGMHECYTTSNKSNVEAVEFNNLCKMMCMTVTLEPVWITTSPSNMATAAPPHTHTHIHTRTHIFSLYPYTYDGKMCVCA